MALMSMPMAGLLACPDEHLKIRLELTAGKSHLRSEAVQIICKFSRHGQFFDFFLRMMT